MSGKKIMVLSHLRLVAEPEKCTGCQICEIVCASENNLSRNDSKIRILRMEELGVYIPVIRIDCSLCGGGTMCTRFCPTGAIRFVKMNDAAMLRKSNKIGAFPSPIISARGGA